MSTGETQVSFHVQLNCDLIESEDFFNFTQFFEKITKIIFPYSCKAQNKNEDTHLHCFRSLISFKNTLKLSTLSHFSQHQMIPRKPLHSLLN